MDTDPSYGEGYRWSVIRAVSFNGLSCNALYLQSEKYCQYLFWSPLVCLEGIVGF